MDEKESETDQTHFTMLSRLHLQLHLGQDVLWRKLFDLYVEKSRQYRMITMMIVRAKAVMKMRTIESRERLRRIIIMRVTARNIELLQIMGIPYVISPSEAEAQCAKLEELGKIFFYDFSLSRSLFLQ